MGKDILILGKGFIGERLQEELKCPVSTKRIRTFNDVYGLIKKYRPKIIINCIGHTGKKNVDGCEAALDKTLQANAYVPLLLAEAALRENIKLIHLSSGCIYHGTPAPITETKIPDYYDLYYSRSKIYAENALEQLSKHYDILIARIRVPLDNRPHPKNILTKLLSFKKVIDNPNSITYIPDFIRALKLLIRKNAKGTYNIALKGGLYYNDILNTYNKAAVKKHAYKVIKLKNLKLKRTNLLLSTAKLEKAGFKVRTPKEVIKECVKEYLRSS
ncbi:MAG TPA: sugar nucleotide-binding protein [Candidatus Omnitrophota bacterium]|nr:sugar nucleotide-binding protein [Candidatus Omnitrophota bacterium]